MEIRKIRFFSFLFVLATCICFFNVYYFLLKPGVWPDYYVKKLFSEPIDDILNLEVYKDLTDEYNYFNAQHSNKVFIVFVGDSITKRFNIQEFAYDNNILNRGIFFDTTLGLLNRLDQNINNLKIEKLFLMIGYNDLKFRSNDEIVGNIREILLKSKANTKYLFSLLPVKSSRSEDNRRIVYINKHLKQIAKENKYLYIDVHSHFADSSGGINPELTSDGIHPNILGYKKWFLLVGPLL